MSKFIVVLMMLFLSSTEEIRFTQDKKSHPISGYDKNVSGMMIPCNEEEYQEIDKLINSCEGYIYCYDFRRYNNKTTYAFVFSEKTNVKSEIYVNKICIEESVVKVYVEIFLSKENCIPTASWNVAIINGIDNRHLTWKLIETYR